MMNIPRSTYYYRPKSFSMERQKLDADLRDCIERIALEFTCYGYRRVTAQLKREGWCVNHKRVTRIMREESLQCQIRKKWVTTTDSNHPFPVYPNLIGDIAISGYNQVWVADITYIRILSGFIYLAVLLDLFSRKVIGWALSQRIDTGLTLAALRMAIEDRRPPAGCIHHSDRGVQYASHEYVEVLKGAGMRISMSRKGNPYDNAACESFIKTLKQEEVYLWDYRTLEDVKNRIPHFLCEVYNQKRLHSSLGYRTPDEYEMIFKPASQNGLYSICGDEDGVEIPPVLKPVTQFGILTAAP